MAKQFEVGKTYRFAEGYGPHDPTVRLTTDDGTFTCHDNEPCAHVGTVCWSMDCTCGGEVLTDGQGWCVAVEQRLIDGEVIEVA